MLVPHLLKIYLGLGWPSSYIITIKIDKIKKNKIVKNQKKINKQKRLFKKNGLSNGHK